MSLVATLLLNQPVTLPAGAIRAHRMDRESARRPFSDRECKAFYQSQAAHRARVERVYKAIAAGMSTDNELCAALSIPKGTICKYIRELMADPEGPRVIATKPPGKHKCRILTAVPA